MTPRRLATSGTLLGLATALAAAGNFGLNLVLCRVLGASDFRMIASVATIILLLSMVAAGIQLQVAAGADSVWIRRVRRASIVLAGVGAATSMPVGAALLVSPELLLVTALGVPFHADLALRRGVEQRRLRFGWLAGSLVVESVIRVTLTAVLVAVGAGALGAVVATNAAFGLTSGAMTFGTTATPTTAARPTVAGRRPAGLWSLSSATAAMTNVDVLLVGALLPAGNAGRYAAVAVVARASFLVAVPIQNIVVPAVASSGGRAVARAGLALAALAALAVVAGLAAAGDMIVSFLLPDVDPAATAAAAATMAVLGIAAALVGVTSIAAATAATSGNRVPSIVLCAAAVTQPFVLLAAPADMASIARAQLLIAAVGTAGVVAASAHALWRSPLGVRPVLPIGTS